MSNIPYTKLSKPFWLQLAVLTPRDRTYLVLVALHEQARIWISWCCRMFGIKAPLEFFE